MTPIAPKRAALGVGVAGLALLLLTASPLSAHTPPEPPTPTPGSASATAPTHEQMHQMMDAMHGEGASERMHEAMGQGDAERGERLMQQCADMMVMMQHMRGMMDDRDSQPMPGMPGR